jgi:hypothetical protein
MDWGSFYWAPSDVFGSGKVLVFGHVIDKDGSPYAADIRGVLKGYADGLHEKKGYTLNAANEIEGFLFAGTNAERRYHESGKFEYVTRAATTTPCRAIPYARSSTLPPKCSGPWAFRMRRTIPKSLLPNSKSTMDMAKLSLPRIRSSFTN